MFRAKRVIIAAAVSILALSCMENDDERINREILLATIWEGECFQALSRTEAGTDEECLYVFGEDGILNVYNSGAGVTASPLQRLRYIYTPKSEEIVIESYGLFAVKEINVDRLRLEGAVGKLDLRFYGDTGAVKQSVP